MQISVTNTGTAALKPLRSDWPLGVTVFIRPEEVHANFMNIIPSNYTCNKGMGAITVFDEEVADFSRTTSKETHSSLISYLENHTLQWVIS